MIKLIIEKELKQIINSRKFIVSFSVLSLLIIISISVGISDYKTSYKDYSGGVNLSKLEMENSRSWKRFAAKAYREPGVLQIINNGISRDAGRYTILSKEKNIHLIHSSYSDNPLYSVFRFADFSTIVMIVFALFAIIFAYNSVNEEKEEGTLRLLFSNSLLRKDFIIGKIMGSILALVIPVLIPLGISFLLIYLNVNMKPGEIVLLLLIFLVSILYFIFWITFSVFISSVTKRSSISFLILLASWVIFLFVIPRIGIVVSSQIVKLPAQGEIESIIDKYNDELTHDYFDKRADIYNKYSPQTEGMNYDQRQAFYKEKEWEIMEATDNLRKEIDKKRESYSKKIYEELNNKKKTMEEMTFVISGISPASMYQIITSNLAGTSLNTIKEYERQLDIYKSRLFDFIDMKGKTEDDFAGGIGIAVSNDGTVKIIRSKREEKIDVSEVPQFQFQPASIGDNILNISVECSILILYTFISCLGGFIAFNRYDLR